MTESSGQAAFSDRSSFSGPASDASIPAALSPGAWARFLIPAIVGLAGDLAVKAWAFPNGVKATLIDLGPGEPPAEIVGRAPTFLQTAIGPVNTPPTTLIPNVLGLHTTINHGAVFGKFQGHVTFFLLFSILAMGVIVWVFLSSKRAQWVVHFSLGMITAGALGNLYDRAIYDGVRDMFQFNVSWYPYIFNVADVLLCVGVPLLMLRWALEGRRQSIR
jgi:signal peptidase II